jgi:fructose transport system ATP-binding protein
MRTQAKEQLDALGIATVQDITQPVESLSGGQRQAVAVARAAMFGKMLVIMDEPTAALGVRETEHVLDLIKRIRDKGLPVILISHDMPAIFEVADRIHIHRLGRRTGVVDPKHVTMSDTVAFITGASEIPSTPTQGSEQ